MPLGWLLCSWNVRFIHFNFNHCLLWFSSCRFPGISWNQFVFERFSRIEMPHHMYIYVLICLFVWNRNTWKHKLYHKLRQKEVQNLFPPWPNLLVCATSICLSICKHDSIRYDFIVQCHLYFVFDVNIVKWILCEFGMMIICRERVYLCVCGEVNGCKSFNYVWAHSTAQHIETLLLLSLWFYKQHRLNINNLTRMHNIDQNTAQAHHSRYNHAWISQAYANIVCDTKWYSNNKL